MRRKSTPMPTASTRKANMRKLTILGIALVAVLVASVAVAASASAAVPKFLPGTGTLAIKSGTGHLQTVGGSKVICEKDTGSGTITSETHGTFKVKFENCESEGFIKAKCSGLSEAGTNNISTEGSFLLRHTLGTTPKVVVVFAVEPVHFSCSIVLVKVSGTLACPITPTNKKVKTTEHYTVTCKQTNGAPEVAEVDNEAETAMESVGLSTSTNEGTPEASAEETTEEVSSTVEGEIMG